jgi:uncharacterized protein (TIGR01777 family)
MNTHTFIRRASLPVSAEEAFAWHERPGALQRLIPPWQIVEVLQQTGGLADGARVELVTHIGPLSFIWLLEHHDCEPGRQFRDVALRSPFAYWDHLHRFEPEGPTKSVLEDRIQYVLPGGAAGKWLAAAYVDRQLQRLFRYRHDTTAADLALHARYALQPRMKIAVTGSSGLIGSALAPFLTSGGHQVQRLQRHKTTGNIWEENTLEAEAVVHLAGENISGRWTPAKKSRIRTSRVEGTQALCQWLARQQRPPKVLVCASAIGYYGHRGEELLDEQSAPGEGFLAETARAWENAAAEAEQCGIRVVFLRLGIVLTPRGGALARMLPQFQCGAGGRIGNGRQYWSWLSLDDVLGAIHHALITDSLAGPVNAVAPQPATNAELTAALGSVLRRPTLLPMPAAAIKTLLGEMAEELLLSSARVIPQKLLHSGYCFRHAELAAALRHMLGRK